MVDQRARTCRSSTPISVQIVSRARYRSTHSGTIEGPALIFADMPGQIGSKYPFCGGESDKIPVLVGTTPTRSLLKYGRRVSLQLGLALFP
jgi:hypothetical protein